MASKSRIDCLKILGLPVTATEEEIKKAYRQKALELHPDKNHNDPKATERFQNLKQAYETLLCPVKAEQDEEHEIHSQNLREFEMFMRFAFAQFAMQQAQARFGSQQFYRRFNNPYADSQMPGSFVTCPSCGRRYYRPRNLYKKYCNEECAYYKHYNTQNFQTGFDPAGDTKPYRPKQKRSKKKKTTKQKTKQRPRKKAGEKQPTTSYTENEETYQEINHRKNSTKRPSGSSVASILAIAMVMMIPISIIVIFFCSKS